MKEGRKLEKKICKAFKALGEPTRLRIIKILSLQSMCVCELSEVLDMLQPRVSQHLKILREVELVRENKEGYWVYYTLDKEKLHNLWNEFISFLDSDLKNLPGFEKESERFSNLACNERIKTQKETLKRGNTK